MGTMALGRRPTRPLPARRGPAAGGRGCRTSQPRRVSLTRPSAFSPFSSVCFDAACQAAKDQAFLVATSLPMMAAVALAFVLSRKTNAGAGDTSTRTRTRTRTRTVGEDEAEDLLMD